MVKRYDPDIESYLGEYCAYMNENPCGDWVTFEEYLKLEQQLREAIDEIHRINIFLDRMYT
jgi:hypothetical protein